MLSSMSRLLHFGPLIAISIIKCVTFTTLIMTSQWFQMSDGLLALINYLIYYTLIATVMYNFFSAIFIGPGFVPKGWHPLDENECQFLQFCSQCNGYKPARSHHCRQCDRCVLKMDHHCPWINNCCGHRNQSYFTLFLLCAVLGSIQSIILLTIGLYRAFHLNWYLYNGRHDRLVYISMTSLLFSVFSIGLSVGVLIAVGGLLILQLKIIIRNKTSIEEWIVTKAMTRKRDNVFLFPYNIGFWNNIKQVFFESHNGITWPVIEGCNQYSLTVEQIQQKQEKKSRSALYRAIGNYTGRWFPLFSQGFRICLSFPITDEPRIAIKTGDNIVVTRWKKHWLYGQKIKNDSTRERGWFPSKCVVKVIVANQTNYEKYKNCFNNKQNEKLN